MSHDAKECVELVLPLTEERPWHDNEDAGRALGQQLRNHKPGFDGLSETHLIGQDAAAGGDAAQCEHHRIDLVRIGIDATEPL